jgi:hypothetical protein
METVLNDAIEEKRVSAVLRDDANLHSIFINLDLLIRDGKIVKEGLPLLCGYEVPAGYYELHYEWQGRSIDRSVWVVDGILKDRT